jgi:hypothetical protein
MDAALGLLHCSAVKVGRRERIRTSGPHVPNVVLYQAELLSVAKEGVLITMHPCSRNREDIC